MELIKNYDLVIDHHPKKANVVADALIRKSSTTLAHIHIAYVPLLLDYKTLGITLPYDYHGALIANFMLRSTLIDQIKDKQMQNNDLVREVHKIMNGKLGENFMITQNGVLVIKGRMCVRNVDNPRKAIMEEAHCFAYVIYLDNTKMY